MADELLPYYRRERDYLHKMGAEFAQAHPKLAGRLRMDAEAIEDPHVSRLVESVAFLNARVRRKLDDDFPELTDALLSVLYPHYLAPIPSMSVVEFVSDKDLTSGYEIPRGTQIETDPIDGEPCRFRTAYPVTSLPVSIAKAEVRGVPFEAPRARAGKAAVATLRLSITPRAPQVAVHELAPTKLRFYIAAGPPLAYDLYELIHNDVLELAIATGPGDPSPQLCGPEAIRPVGFELDESLLPAPGRAQPAYRLLSEFFAFPEKFLFFDVEGIDPKKVAECGERLELFFYLRRTDGDLEQGVDERCFRLGCTPVVNLFSRRADPIPLTRTESEVHVVPDERVPRSMEIYSIDNVEASSARGGHMPFRPFYGIDHLLEGQGEGAYFHASRRPAPPSDGRTDTGTEVYLSLVDLYFQPSAPADWVLDVEATCLNRDLPNRLPFGGGQPRLTFSEGGAPIERIDCLKAFTPTRRPETGSGSRWRLISHLSLNHLSISPLPHESVEKQRAEGARALKEILRLYEPTATPESRACIAGLTAVECRPKTLRTMSGGQPGFCRGLEVEVELDESRFSGSGVYLFGCILERFFGLYGSPNSFTQTVLKTNAREGEVRRWTPRTGDTHLL